MTESEINDAYRRGSENLIEVGEGGDNTPNQFSDQEEEF